MVGEEKPFGEDILGEAVFGPSEPEDAGSPDATVNLTGVAGAGYVGGFFGVPLVGVQGTTAVGTITVQQNRTVNLTGVSATTAIGHLIGGVPHDETINLTGVSATGYAGIIPINVIPLGVTGFGIVGTIGVLVPGKEAPFGDRPFGDAPFGPRPTGVEQTSIPLFGVSATGRAGTILIANDGSGTAVGVLGVCGVGTLTISFEVVESGIVYADFEDRIVFATEEERLVVA